MQERVGAGDLTTSMVHLLRRTMIGLVVYRLQVLIFSPLPFQIAPGANLPLPGHQGIVGGE